MFSFKSFDMQYAPFLSFIFFVSEANLQDPPVSPSVSPSVTFFKNSCPDNSS